MLPDIGMMAGRHVPSELQSNAIDAESYLRGTGSADYTGHRAPLQAGDARSFRYVDFAAHRKTLIMPEPFDPGPRTRPGC